MAADRQPASATDKHQVEHDPIAESIGNYGRWQLKMTFLLSLCSFPCTFHIFSPTFIGGQVDFWCARPKHLRSVDPHLWMNRTQPNGSCSIYDYDWNKLRVATVDVFRPNANDTLMACDAWEWDTAELGATIVSEWRLVCDRQYLNTLAEGLFLFGIALGGIVSGWISDRFGRKKTLLASLVMQTLIGVAITFCPMVEVYLLMRFTLGLFSVSVVFSAFVLIVELVGGKWRTMAGVCNFFPLPVSYIVVTLMSWALPDWRHLQLALSLPGALLISLWWIVPESPHWLLTMGRIDEVKEIVHEAVAFNRRKTPPNLDKILQPQSNHNHHNQQPQHQMTVLDLLRGPTGKITVCVFIMWFATTIVYYGVVLNVNSFGGDLHTTSILTGVVELPAIALSIPMMLKLGRRYLVCTTILVAAIGCLAVALVEALAQKQWLKITLVMVSKFSISATNGVLPTFTAELYPTLMRNMGVGASQVSAGIGLVSIPYLWTMVSSFKMFPMLVMGVIGIVGGLCVLLLPETANRSLTSVRYDTEKPPAVSSDNSISRNGPFTITETKKN